MVQGLIGTYKYSQFAFRDSSGYPKGVDSTPDAVSNGTVLNAYLYDKGIDISGMSVTYDTRQGQGGGKIWVKRVSGVSDVGDITLNMSAYDTTLDGYFKGQTPDATTNTNMIISSRNVNKLTLPAFVSVHAFEFDNADGSAMWLNRVILNGQFKQVSGIGSGQGSGTNPNPLTYECTPNKSSRAPWGQLLSANTNLDVADDSDYELWIYSRYPLALATYIDDGAASSFAVAYKVATGEDKADCLIFKNGSTAQSAVSGITNATGAFAITAGTAADIWCVLYPTEFDPV